MNYKCYGTKYCSNIVKEDLVNKPESTEAEESPRRNSLSLKERKLCCNESIL